MGEGIPIVLPREKLLLIGLVAFLRREAFCTIETRDDLKRKRGLSSPWNGIDNRKAVETISAQVVGLGEITSMNKQQKGTREMRQEALISITDKNFGEEVVQSDLPVLVDFWAPWCSPCRTVGPVVKGVAKEYEGRIKVGEMNVSENLLVSSASGIRSLPTLILFKDGKAVKKVEGALPEFRLKTMIEESIQHP